MKKIGQKGAQRLCAEQRKELANDPLNLLAADEPTNDAKGRQGRRHLAAAEQGIPLRVLARQTAGKAE
jgi:hypothetical protein